MIANGDINKLHRIKIDYSLLKLELELKVEVKSELKLIISYWHVLHVPVITNTYLTNSGKGLTIKIPFKNYIV